MEFRGEAAQKIGHIGDINMGFGQQSNARYAQIGRSCGCRQRRGGHKGKAGFRLHLWRTGIEGFGMSSARSGIKFLIAKGTRISRE